jgi:mannose/fructose/N-acetylgalactosamine-specific phosphotransferase system component IIC
MVEYNGFRMKSSILLLVDAIINLILGALLLFISKDIIHFLGIPDVEVYFYPNILGGVLFGIGLALLLEYLRKPRGLVGLGLGGAVAINLSGGLVLVGWLVFGNLHLPTHGMIILWILVVILIGLSGTELAVHRYHKRPHSYEREEKA